MRLLYRPEIKAIIARLAKISLFILGFFLIWWFVSASDLGRITQQLGSIGYKFIFIILVTLTAQLLVTTAWRYCFIERPDIGIFRLFFIRLMGESLAQINPTSFLAGETMKAVVLSRHGVPYSRSITALTIARLTVWLSSGTLIGIGIVLFLDKLNFAGSKVIMAVVASGLLSGATFFLLRLSNGHSFFALFPAILRRLIPWFKGLLAIERKLQKVDSDLFYFFHHRRKDLARAYGLTLLHWLGGATEFFLILTFLGVEVSFLSCVAMEVGVMLFKAMGTFVPGQVGIEEYANRLMLDLVGVPGADLWISVSILRRTRQLFWLGMGTLVFSLFMMRRRKELDPSTAVAESYGSPVHHS